MTPAMSISLTISLVASVMLFATGMAVGLLINSWRVEQARRDMEALRMDRAELEALCERFGRRECFLLARIQEDARKLELYRQGDGWKVEAGE